MEMEKKFVQVTEQEVRIDFSLGCKCRTKITLTSLSQSTPIAFKVQTSSPNKFLVNPPNGLIPPSSSASFQVILKPQTHLPSSFPRSLSDRFLIKTALAHRLDPANEDINSWFAKSPGPTQDIKLKVLYVGSFLLRHAVASGQIETVKHMIKRQKSAVSKLPAQESMSLLEAASSSGSVQMLTLLLEAGLRLEQVEKTHVEKTGLEVDVEEKPVQEGGGEKKGKSSEGKKGLYRAAANGGVEMVRLLAEKGADPTITTVHGKSPLDVARDKGHKDIVEILEQGELVLTAARRGDSRQLESLLRKGTGLKHCDQYGLTALHAAAIKGHTDIVAMLIEFGMDLECPDAEGHTPLHLAVEGGNVETVGVLIDKGADINARTKRGAAPLYIAKSMGYDNISKILLNRGASSSCLQSSSSSLSSSSLS